MGTELRAPPATLNERFRTQPWRFDFWQSVRMLEGKPFRYASNVSQGFPASDVQSLAVERGSSCPELTVNFLGLAGPHGPLPPPITELILDRTKRGDTALHDFLDIFNHRLVTLYHRGVSPTKPGTGAESRPSQTELAEYLYAVSGLLTPGLKTPENVRFLPHAVLFANVRKTASGLEKIISERFGVKATVEEFQGRWLEIDEKDRTQLGRSNNRLSDTAMLGGRFWNQAAGFVLRLEKPVDDTTELRNIVRFYPGDGLHCEVKQTRKNRQTDAI